MGTEATEASWGRDTLPEECQLCRPLDYRHDDINEPEGMVEVEREDGGTKIIHCCQRCAQELFTRPGFTPYEDDDQEVNDGK